MSSNQIFKFLRYALAVAALVLLLLKIDHAKPLERLATAQWPFVLLALVVVVIDGMARAWNWRQLIQGMHVAPRVRYATVLGISWAGAFLGQVLPSTVGTDALRAVMAARKIGGHASAHAAAVVLLNAISLTVGCAAALACAGYLRLTGAGHGVRLPAVLLFLAAISAALSGYWLLRVQRGLLLRLLRLAHGPLRKLRRGVRRFMHRVLVIERYHVPLTPIVLTALLTLGTRATIYLLVGHAVGVVLPFAAWMALVPAYTLSGLIPYSVSGYGGDQAAIVYILTGFGADGGGALTFALVVPLMGMAFNMLGGLSVLFGNLDVKENVQSISSPERAV